jgi:hypothetical protein
MAQSLTPTRLAAESAGDVKFAQGVPGELLMDMLRHRLADPARIEVISAETITQVVVGGA